MVHQFAFICCGNDTLPSFVEDTIVSPDWIIELVILYQHIHPGCISGCSMSSFAVGLLYTGRVVGGRGDTGDQQEEHHQSCECAGCTAGGETLAQGGGRGHTISPQAKERHGHTSVFMNIPA